MSVTRVNNLDDSKTTTVVIFGASGDLTQRKLVPALFSLYRKGRLPKDFRVVGVARTPLGDEPFRRAMREGVCATVGGELEEQEWDPFAQRLMYYAGDLAKEGEEDRLAGVLKQMEGGPANRVYYLSMPPQFFAGIVLALGRAGMADESEGQRRVVVEKPFGTDLKSAHDLTAQLHKVLSEKQIYRIDHYLGKETVQNVLVFRFANSIFEPIWNRNYIDHVQITVAEKVGIEHRGKFYDGVGVLRDMFQNHLLQLMTLVAMEPPASFQADAQRNERVKVLSAVRPIAGKDVKANTVRGQYLGYRNEEGVARDSKTATYAAMRLFVDNWRWQGVPFYLRSGKCLADKNTIVVIHFKRPPHLMFPMQAERELTPNLLAIRLQPDEGIHLRFEAKVPGTAAEMCSVDMEFSYDKSFSGKAIPDAYERLLLDSLAGDQALFTRSDQIELSWQLMDPIIAAWETPDAPPLAIYEQGSWGPYQADEFLAHDGRGWSHGTHGKMHG